MSDISTSEQGSPTSKTLDDKDSDTDPDTNNNRQLCAHNAATPPPDALPREPRIGVEGNWPTFVYLSFPLPIDLYETLPSLLSQTLANLPPGVELKRVNPLEEAYHLSLSKTVYLKLFQIDRFVANLKKRLKGSKKFSIGFANLSTFRNDADSKSFLGLMVGAGGGQVN
ncbi:hypothetical protein DFS34DRAFT_290296 [Phlyctochytrium arcticum]|nr:hypothetical protein DFS34DRAFT_290296 [Phlyctochytrium arcticum]